jgi:hypothetical protein
MHVSAKQLIFRPDMRTVGQRAPQLCARKVGPNEARSLSPTFGKHELNLGITAANEVAQMRKQGRIDRKHVLGRRDRRRRDSLNLYREQGRLGCHGSRIWRSRSAGMVFARQSGCYRYSFLTSALPPEAVTALGAHSALGCIGHPDDIAGAVTWLSSPEAAFVTGQSILVDGGYNIGGMG